MILAFELRLIVFREPKEFNGPTLFRMGLVRKTRYRNWALIEEPAIVALDPRDDFILPMGDDAPI